jgi:hypothetical protein
MTGEIRQTGIEHRGDVSVAGEMLGDLLRAAAGALDPYRQRPHAAL